MASSQEVTLAGRHRTSVVRSRKTSRSQLPVFLQKLYEMLNDPKNYHLIRWSEAGDSFIVPNDDQLARELLGRWFKHRRFQSFVRQLNMYGFRKIPALQQGVLKSDSDIESWNFEHPHFRRGEPHLLNSIQRKRNAGQAAPADFVIEDVTGTLNFNDTTSINDGTLASGRALDIQSILNEIGAIKHLQSSVQAELAEVKRLNQLLWQDVIDGRTKYDKQQDTLNRIVKFLAGMFGNRAGSHGKHEDAMNFGSFVTSQRRLMIEDGRSKKGGVTEVRGGNPTMELPLIEPEGHFLSVEEQVSASTPPPSDNIITQTPTQFDSYNLHPQPQTLPPSPPVYSQHLPPPPQPPQPQSEVQHLQDPAGQALIPRSPNPSQNLEIEHVLSQLTPQQISQLLSSTLPSADTSPPDSHGSALASSQLTPYQAPPFDFSHLTQPCWDKQDQDLTSFDSAVPSLEEQWKATDNLEEEVDMLDSSIHSFMQEMQDMGVDSPRLDVSVDSLLNTNQQQSSPHLLAAHHPVHLAQSQSESHPSSNGDDSYIYNFLNLEHDDYAADSDFGGGYQSMVSLDDVQAPSDLERRSASPVCSKNSGGWGKRKPGNAMLDEVQMEIPEPILSGLPPKQGMKKINTDITGTFVRPAKRRKS